MDPSIRELAGGYFFILYLPMLPRTASIIFGTVLRAAGDTKTPMRMGIMVNMINVVLNTLLIYPTRQVWFFTMPGADWGVYGAAIASAVAFTVGGLAMTLALWRHPGRLAQGTVPAPGRTGSEALPEGCRSQYAPSGLGPPWATWLLPP